MSLESRNTTIIKQIRHNEGDVWYDQATTCYRTTHDIPPETTEEELIQHVLGNRYYSPPKVGPTPQMPPPSELVREGAVSRETRFLRGDFDQFEVVATLRQCLRSREQEQ